MQLTSLSDFSFLSTDAAFLGRRVRQRPYSYPSLDMKFLSSRSKGQVALWSSASTKNRISLFAMSAFQHHSMCFFPLTGFTFCSGKGHVHPPSVSMCFFLISSLCKLMGVIVALVRSHWGSGFPGSHRQAHEEYMVAAALGGSTDMHA